MIDLQTAQECFVDGRSSRDRAEKILTVQEVLAFGKGGTGIDIACPATSAEGP